MVRQLSNLANLSLNYCVCNYQNGRLFVPKVIGHFFLTFWLLEFILFVGCGICVGNTKSDRNMRSGSKCGQNIKLFGEIFIKLAGNRSLHACILYDTAKNEDDNADGDVNVCVLV